MLVPSPLTIGIGDDNPSLPGSDTRDRHRSPFKQVAQ